MNRHHATALLTAKYALPLVTSYLNEVADQFPNEDEYWAKYVKTDEELLHDMDLFVEALGPGFTLELEPENPNDA